jgi:hypothetical protein
MKREHDDRSVSLAVRHAVRPKKTGPLRLRPSTVSAEDGRIAEVERWITRMEVDWLRLSRA